MTHTIKSSAPETGDERRSHLGEPSRFEGRWTGENLTVEGLFDGELNLSGRLRIERAGRVSGRVRAQSIEVAGEFEGELRARLLVFDESARAKGTFISERLTMKDGAKVDGGFAPGEASNDSLVARGAARQTAPTPPPAQPEPAATPAGTAARPEGAGASSTEDGERKAAEASTAHPKASEPGPSADDAGEDPR